MTTNIESEFVQAGIQPADALLQVLEMNPHRLRSHRPPLLMEFGVNPELAPFLVSSTRSLQWVRPSSRRTVSPSTRVLRAAVRPMPDVHVLFREVLAEIVETGVEAEWGNVHPLTPEGVLAAIAHVRSYDLTELEMLAHPETKWPDGVRQASAEDGSEWVAGCELRKADWMDPGVVVVLPADRTFVGFVLRIGESHGLAVVHNACRGVAILR